MGVRVDLRPRHRVGRAPDADLRLDDPHISGDHAMLRWEHGTWVVQDLGSTNGVYVDGQRLGRGAVQPLDPGTVVGFGDVSGWELIDASAPTADALSEAGERRVAQGDRLDLGGAVVQFSPDRGWILDDSRGRRSVADGAHIVVTGVRWKLRLPDRLPRTARTREPLVVAACRLRSVVSQDREHVRLFLQGGDGDRDLGEHIYGDLILRLAERRREDGRSGVATEEQGWVEREDLLHDHKIDAGTLSQWLHRFRQALGRAGLQEPESAIERRRGALRIALLLSS